MTRMRLPLKECLQDPVDEAALHRIAIGLDARRRARNRHRATSFAMAGVAVAAAMTAALSRHYRDPGPLLLADGREIGAVDAGIQPKHLALSDGSRIELASGAQLEPVESSGTSFWAIVTRGRADFEIRPGGPRHWTVECGLATVEVVGTSFTCDRAPSRLQITVRHGVVLVRGERVPNRARRLTAGESLDLSDDARPLESGRTPFGAVGGRGGADPINADPLAGGLPAADVDGKRADLSLPRNAGARIWRDLAQHGRHREAFAALGSEGLRRESKRLAVSDLLVLADVARLSGHPAEAVVPLERIVTEFASDPQAALAAFALGRLELDSLGQAHAAVSALRRALALGIPRGLREDVRARLVEACSRSGDPAAAQRAADDYFNEFPNGRHARAIQGWLHPR